MEETRLHYPLLCLVTDPEVPDLLEAVEESLAAGVDMLQLRGHALCAAQLYQLALPLRALCQRYRTTFIVNDRLDIGLAVQADGIQLGTRSLPLPVARQILTHASGPSHPLLGASIHSREEARTAVAEGADFLIAGTLFASRSHPEETGQGLAWLHALKQAVPTCPILAIGGITAENAAQVIEAGADGVAVISAILRAPNKARAVNELRRAIKLNERRNTDEPTEHLS